MNNKKFWVVFIGLIIATGFLGFSSLIEISYFGINFSTLFTIVLFVLGLYVIIKTAFFMHFSNSRKNTRGKNRCSK